MSYWKSIFDDTKWEIEDGDPGEWNTDHWELCDSYYCTTTLDAIGTGPTATKMKVFFSTPATTFAKISIHGSIINSFFTIESGEEIEFTAEIGDIYTLEFTNNGIITITDFQFYVDDIEKTIEETAVASDAVEFFSLSDAFEETAGAGDSIDAEMEYNLTLTETAQAADVLTGFREMELDPITEITTVGDSINGFNWTTFLAQYEDLLITRFYFTLTGAEDGETDVELSMSSFNCRLRSGDPTYLQVVVPGVDQSAVIAARTNGQLVIEMDYPLSGVSQHREEIVRVDLEDINIYQGGNNKSIVLIGHKTVSHADKIVDLKHVSYQATVSGDQVARAAIDMYLKPGDTARYDGDTFTVGSISIVVGEKTRTMEVNE